ncbi:MAG: hypothetical protein ACOYB4_01285 [Methyloceanibacter sp.]
MRSPPPNVSYRAAVAIGAALVFAVLPACSTVGSIKTSPGASSEKEARNVKPDDPMARPVQVGWTSARASHCGFIFSPEQLRSNYLAAEARTGVSPQQMEKIKHAYDYTRQSTHDTIKDNLNYCNKERTTAIQQDLNRYLAGDYRPTARVAR